MDDPMADRPRPVTPAPVLGEAMRLPGAEPTSSPTGLTVASEEELAAAQNQLDQVLARVDAGLQAGEVDEVVAVLHRSIQDADASGPSLVAAHAAQLRADVLWLSGRPTEARKAARDAVSRAERLGKPSLAATARVIVGCACLELERHQEAVDFLEAAVPALPEDDPGLRARATHALGRALLGAAPAAAAARLAQA
ncbi:MAG TPA: tetratricopeptide repeat protein, partial [Cryptosporangiaceae bacterium]|nr:tetratricopeptide repeat protein [Cryptosporangiaceae bacterium]